jgi:hypothetical protein
MRLSARPAIEAMPHKGGASDELTAKPAAAQRPLLLQAPRAITNKVEKSLGIGSRPFSDVWMQPAPDGK